MRRKLASALAATACAVSLFCTPVYAEDTAETQLSQEASAQETEEALTEAEISVPENRPEYQASDYVKIKDEAYKGISVTLYPPVDDSEEAKTAYETELDTQIMTQLFTMYPVTGYPEELMNYVKGSLINTYKEYASSYGMDFASFLQTYLKVDESTFESQVTKAAQQTLNEELILKAIAEKENITLSDEEYAKGCEDYAVRYGYESADALKVVFDEEVIRISLLMDKVFQMLETQAQITLIIETETESETEGFGDSTEAETTAAQAAAAPAEAAAAQDAAAETAPAETAAPQDAAAEAAPAEEAAAE